MWISITEASKNWGVSRTTIHAKINKKLLSKDENWLIDPAEMSRIFWKPKKKKVVLNSVQNALNEHNWTEEKNLLQQQLEFEQRLRLEAEKRVSEWKDRAERAEQREQHLLQQMNNLTETMKLPEAPKLKKAKWFNWFG